MVNWGGVEDMGDENSIHVAMAMKLSGSDKGSCHERTMRTLALGVLSTKLSWGGGEKGKCNQAMADESKMRWNADKRREEKRDSKIKPINVYANEP